MIVVNLDVMLAKRKMSMTELSQRVGITMANLSILKNGKSRAIRMSTLDAVCTALSCQPGELLEWVDEAPAAAKESTASASPAKAAREAPPEAGRKRAKRKAPAPRAAAEPAAAAPAAIPAPEASAPSPSRAKRAPAPERKPARRNPPEPPAEALPEKRRRSKPAPDLHTIVTGGGRLNLRDQDSRSGAVVGLLSDGMQVELLEIRGQWANVRTGDRQGWVLARYVR